MSEGRPYPIIVRDEVTGQAFGPDSPLIITNKSWGNKRIFWDYNIGAWALVHGVNYNLEDDVIEFYIAKKGTFTPDPAFKLFSVKKKDMNWANGYYEVILKRNKILKVVDATNDNPIKDVKVYGSTKKTDENGELNLDGLSGEIILYKNYYEPAIIDISQINTDKSLIHLKHNINLPVVKVFKPVIINEIVDFNSVVIKPAITDSVSIFNSQYLPIILPSMNGLLPSVKIYQNDYEVIPFQNKFILGGKETDVIKVVYNKNVIDKLFLKDIPETKDYKNVPSTIGNYVGNGGIIQLGTIVQPEIQELPQINEVDIPISEIESNENNLSITFLLYTTFITSVSFPPKMNLF
ncbi:MAG: hypothetical protein GXO49_04130, partial [Chlorobi bacterium]|nr:hypothetical protein [Chlorobiota bacterium]